MRKLTVVTVLAMAVGCVSESGDEPPEQPGPEEPAPTAPAPMTVAIDWSRLVDSGGGFDVKEIAVNPVSFGGGKAAVQLVLSGSVTAPGGSMMKLQINNGTGWWEYGGMRSSDYEAASCGSWQMSKTDLFRHTCTAPGAATEAYTTTWSYSMAELFELSGTPDSYQYTAPFKIRIFDGTREIECRELQLDVSRDTQLGAGSSFANDPC